MERSSSAAPESAPHRVLIESESVASAAPVAPAYNPGGSTANFDVSYDSTLGANGQALANAVLASCESDLAKLESFFGIASPGRFTVYIVPGTSGASHAGCSSRVIYCNAFDETDGALENFLNCAEVDEVMMAAQGAGWNCGASAGEGLSRVLAFELHPATQWNSSNRGKFVTAPVWLNTDRPDWVSQTKPTDIDKVSIGCATLFLNYLRHQLHFDLPQIVQAGGTTLQQTYQQLTGSPDAFVPFAALVALHFPPGMAVSLPSDNPFPLRVPAFFDLTLLTDSAHLAGNPTGYFDALDGSLQAFYRDSGGHLSEIWWVGNDKGSNDLTSVAKSPPSASDPAGYYDPSGFSHVIYRANDGHLYELFWTTGAVGYSNLTAGLPLPRAVGNPVGYFYPGDGTNQVIYRTTNGHIYELWWTGGPVGENDLTAFANAPTAAGDPAAYFDSFLMNHVIYRAGNGHLHELSWTTGPVSTIDLTTLTSGALAAGDPAAYFDPAEGTQHAIYRDSHGHLFELWWGKNLKGSNDLTAFAKAPAAASDPAAYFAAAEGTHHVIYRSGDGHLHELYWTTGAVTHRDLTALAISPAAVGKPSAWYAPADSTHHVIYRGTDNHLYELRWNIRAPLYS